MTQRQRRTARQPTLSALICREMDAFATGSAPEYRELRRGWKALHARSARDAIETLARLVGKQVGVSAAITAPLVAELLATSGLDPAG